MNCIPNCCRFDVTRANEALVNCWNSKPVQIGIEAITIVALLAIAEVFFVPIVAMIAIEMNEMGFSQVAVTRAWCILLYSKTLMIAFGLHNISKSFFNRMRGVHSICRPVPRERKKAIYYFGIATIRSFAAWLITTSSVMFIFLGMDVMFWRKKTDLNDIIIFSYLGGIPSVIAVSGVAGRYFKKSFELFFGFVYTDRPQGQLIFVAPPNLHHFHHHQPNPAPIVVQIHDDGGEG